MTHLQNAIPLTSRSRPPGIRGFASQLRLWRFMMLAIKPFTRSVAVAAVFSLSGLPPTVSTAQTSVQANSDVPVLLGTLDAGATYTITTTGIVNLAPSFNNGQGLPFTADGKPTYDFPEPYSPFWPNGADYDPSVGPTAYGLGGPGELYGSLMGTYTATPTQASDYFSLGLKSIITPKTTVSLYGVVNDDDYSDNSGSFTVSLSAVRKPSIASLQLNSLDAGSAAFTLTVNGANFVSGDTVDWNGVSLATTFVSASKLTAKVSAAEVAAAGSAAVRVVDTAVENVASEPALITIPLTSIVVAAQTIKKISSGYSITLTLRNSGFKPATNISLTGAYLATSETSTLLPVDIASIAAGGTTTVTLSFPSGTGKAGEEAYLLLYGSYAGGGISLNSIELIP